MSYLLGSHVRARSSASDGDVGGAFVVSQQVRMSRRANSTQFLQRALVGPAGDGAELALRGGSRHCLLFAGLSFDLFNPHGQEQKERVLWAQ